MATINAAATGNWSAPSTWPGGILPTASDDVHANGKDITINQPVSVLSLNTTAGGGGVSGGRFIVGGNHTITANVNCGTSSSYGALEMSSNYAAAVVGNFVATANYYGAYLTNGTLTITGNSTGGPSTNAHGIWLTSSAAVNMTGNATGGNGSGAFGVYFNGLASTLNGNATGGAGANATGAVATSALTMTGRATPSATANGISRQSGANLINIGTAVGGVNVSYYGVYNATATPIMLKAIDETSGWPAIYGAFRVVPTAGYPITVKTATIAGVEVGTEAFIHASGTCDLPAVTDVRSAVQYSYGTRTGTCAVPGATSVAAGVPVDHTVGTATLDDTAILAAIAGIQIDTAPIIEAINDIDIVSGVHDGLDTWEPDLTNTPPPIIIPPASADVCRVVFYATNPDATYPDDLTGCFCRIVELPYQDANNRFYSGKKIPFLLNVDHTYGYCDIVRGATIHVHAPVYDVNLEITVPDEINYVINI